MNETPIDLLREIEELADDEADVNDGTMNTAMRIYDLAQRARRQLEREQVRRQQVSERDREWEVSFTVTIYAESEQEATDGAWDMVKSGASEITARVLWAPPTA